MIPDKIGKYNGFTTSKGNYMWAGALNLAWTQLCQNIVKEPIKIVSNAVSPAIKMVQNFNHSKFSQNDIDPNSIYIKSGYGQETVDKINCECKKKFPNKSFAELTIKLNPMEIIAYAYLFKNVEFKIPFKRSQSNLFQFEGKHVASFYAENQDQKDQIFYSYYKSSDQFMINMNGKKDGDLIYFIKNKQIQTIDQAIKAVQFYEDKGKNRLKMIDMFQMPIIQFDMKRKIKQLMGKHLANKNVAGYILEYVYEAIKLKIDQKGAIVENQAVIGILGAAMSKNKPQPKYFILDKEFWVVMKQYGKHPYLCSLVKDPTDNMEQMQGQMQE